MFSAYTLSVVIVDVAVNVSDMGITSSMYPRVESRSGAVCCLFSAIRCLSGPLFHVEETAREGEKQNCAANYAAYDRPDRL